MNGIATPIATSPRAASPPMRNQCTSGSRKLPNASRPAQTMKMPISEMCATSPATVLSPTPDTATGRSTPCFCRKRTLRAMPPSPAGASLLANEAAI